MTNAEKIEVLGTYKVSHKEHQRDYSTGSVKTILYSGEDPKTGSRRRMKQVYENLYELKTNTGDVIIDINSGEKVNHVVVVPEIDIANFGFDRLSVDELHNYLSKESWGVLKVNATFDHIHPYISEWQLHFTNEKLDKGYAIGYNKQEIIYCAFYSL